MKFTIVTPEPNPTLLNDLCDPLLGIYDATEEPDEELGVSCTGPYVATSFTAMTDVKMRANENYWGGRSEGRHRRAENYRRSGCAGYGTC